MAAWLVIVLQAPFASFADAPGNAVRKTSDMPTRSALLGLAGAALGITREDQERQQELARTLVTAVALLEPGSILSDFHTFQSLHQAGRGAPTRADALRRKDQVETSITRRDYRTDAIWQGAYRLASEAGATSLEELATAFCRPSYALYVGRRSCPPSHPLNPRIYPVQDVRTAFATHAAETEALAGKVPRIISLEDRYDAPGANALSHHVRRDDPLDRSIRWTFAERAEWRLAPPVGKDRENSR